MLVNLGTVKLLSIGKEVEFNSLFIKKIMKDLDLCIVTRDVSVKGVRENVLKNGNREICYLSDE